MWFDFGDCPGCCSMHAKVGFAFAIGVWNATCKHPCVLLYQVAPVPFWFIYVGVRVSVCIAVSGSALFKTFYTCQYQCLVPLYLYICQHNAFAAWHVEVDAESLNGDAPAASIAVGGAADLRMVYLTDRKTAALHCCTLGHRIRCEVIPASVWYLASIPSVVVQPMVV